MAVAETAPTDTARPRAVLYRMVTPDHRCPWGLRSRHLLQSKGYEVEDHVLTSRAETDAFMATEQVKSTPQSYIGGQRIGGYEDLRRYFDLPVPDSDDETYGPVIALFAVAALMALAIAWTSTGVLLSWTTLLLLGALSMCLFAVQKLRDLDGFATRFLGYDILARHWVPYAWVYPFAELASGLLMLAGIGMVTAGIVSLAIGAIGAVSVIQAVWIEGRKLKCACVGGAGNVPLGPVSLAENVGMIAMGLWMLLG